MKIEPIYAEIGARIKTARKSAGLNQTDVAEILGIARPAVSQMETGRIRIPVRSICEIAAIVNTSPDYLLGLNCRRLKRARG